KCFGGAPFNFAVGASRLGSGVGALCAVGADPFGEFLLETLKENGIDVSQVKVKKARTTLAFVVRHEGGERDFFFYRRPWAETADTLLSPEDLDPKYVGSPKIFHYSGVALSHDPLRSCVKRAAAIAREAGAKVSFDPNIRPDLWESEDSLRESCEDAFGSSDIILLAKDEVERLYGNVPPEEAAGRLFEDNDPQIVAVKLGGGGCDARAADGTEVRKPAFRVDVVDTTGAGDGWAAGFIHGLVNGWGLEKCATVANAVGGLVVTKVGAITAMPTRSELLRFLRLQGTGIAL
ncbi:MAG: carbohydrate kinase, partial [Thermoproteota archaeon]